MVKEVLQYDNEMFVWTIFNADLKKKKNLWSFFTLLLDLSYCLITFSYCISEVFWDSGFGTQLE